YASGLSRVVVATGTDGSGDPSRLVVKPGVYPIEVQLRSASQSLDRLTTYLIALRPAVDGPRLGLAVVVPLGGTDEPASRTDGTSALTTETSRSIVETATVLGAHPAVPVTLLAAPEHLAALTDPAARQQLLDVAKGREVAPSTFVPVDEQAWLAAGIGDDLSSQLDLGQAMLSATLGAPPQDTWVSEGPMAASAATWLAGRGVRSVVVPDTTLTALDARRFNTTLTQPFVLDGVPGMRATTADSALARHLGETGDPVLDASRLLADLAILDLDRPKATRMAVFEVPRTATPAMVEAVLTGVEATRTLQPATLGQLLARVPTAGAAGQTDGSGTPLTRGLTTSSAASLGEFPGRLRAARDDVASYRGTLDPGDLRADALDHLALAAGHRGLGRDAQLERLDAVRSAVAGELHKVEAPSRQTITFTARDGVVSVSLRNTTGHPVHVVLRLEGPRLELPAHPDGVVPLTLAGNEETTRAQIDVRARSSGDAALDVTIETPDGRIVLGRTRITVRSTAFSGVGVVLSAGSLAFLLLWWAKHTVGARRGRRRRSGRGDAGQK
ncbi:MAG: DUF6049 family protein, partial [Acidimicrobiales bacterium]